jgi:hypothetical protein
VLPALGRRKVAAVGLKDVADLHHGLRAKPVQANRVLALVSKMLNLAETWGLRPLHSNPCSRMGRFREGKRKRFLSGAELRRLGEALAAVEQDRSAKGPAGQTAYLRTNSTRRFWARPASVELSATGRSCP